MRVVLLGLVVGVVASAGCAGPDAPRELDWDVPQTSLAESAVIYGVDDRLEPYQVSDPVLLGLSDATVVLVSNSRLSVNADGTYSLATNRTLAQSQGVCATEPFAAQPTPGFCSGVLVGPDVVATAGHCIDASDCSTTWFAFDFEMTPSGGVNSRLPASDVYACSSIIARSNTSSLDYALVRLDRPVTGRTPVQVRASGSVASGASLAISGHPNGLPKKLAGGASVRRNTASGYFEADLDAFGGNSGSPVIDATTGQLEGLLVRGNTDYVRQGSCYVRNVCASTGCPGFEDVTRATAFSGLIPGAVAPPPVPSCVEDAREPNDSSAAALPLGPGAYRGLAVCGGDDDWFSVQVNTGDTLTVSLRFTHADGDVDLDLFSGGTRLARSNSVTDQEAITHTATASGVLWVRVYGYGGDENDYDLTVTITPAPVAAPVMSGAAVVNSGARTGFDGTGLTPGGRAILGVGVPGGATPVARCPGLTLAMTGGVILDQGPATPAGTRSVVVTAPTRAAPGTYRAYAVDVDTCTASAPFDFVLQ